MKSKYSEWSHDFRRFKTFFPYQIVCTANIFGAKPKKKRILFEMATRLKETEEETKKYSFFFASLEWRCVLLKIAGFFLIHVLPFLLSVSYLYVYERYLRYTVSAEKNSIMVRLLRLQILLVGFLMFAHISMSVHIFFLVWMLKYCIYHYTHISHEMRLWCGQSRWFFHF